MLIAATYPFLEVFWSMLVFFAFVVWLWLLFAVLGDVFRRHDISGWGKVAWILVVIVLPYIGVFIYLIAEQAGMAERAVVRQGATTDQLAQRSQAPAIDPAQQIANGKTLLDEGAITPSEFDRIKQQALAT
jgi:hypothetical protein